MNFLKFLFEKRVFILFLSASTPSLLLGFFTSIKDKGKPLIKTVMSGLKESRPFWHSNSVTQLKVLLSKLLKSISRIPL